MGPRPPPRPLQRGPASLTAWKSSRRCTANQCLATKMQGTGSGYAYHLSFQTHDQLSHFSRGGRGVVWKEPRASRECYPHARKVGKTTHLTRWEKEAEAIFSRRLPRERSAPSPAACPSSASHSEECLPSSYCAPADLWDRKPKITMAKVSQGFSFLSCISPSG